MTRDNRLLGSFNLDGIPSAPRGVPKIEVAFDLDSNGILNVSAADQTTGKSNKITITNEKGRLSKDEMLGIGIGCDRAMQKGGNTERKKIERMVKEAEQFRQEDEVLRKNVEARNELERYAYSVKGPPREPSTSWRTRPTRGGTWRFAAAAGSLDREDLKEKFTEEDRTKIQDAVDTTLKWFEENPQADAGEHEAKQKELEGVVNPIMVRTG
eukprot:g2492.t1